MSAAAGMVVTEMNTPMSALARDSVSDTTPTIPARTATTTEKIFGLLMRAETGLTPCRNSSGALPAARTATPKTRVTRIAAKNPEIRASRPSPTAPRSRLLIPSAAAMIALYSGPTTIAPTMRICELVKMPTAPISPAMASRTKKLGEYTPPARMVASTISHTGAISPAGEPIRPPGRAVSVSEASTCCTAIGAS
jgi:hypothetical protein